MVQMKKFFVRLHDRTKDNLDFEKRWNLEVFFLESRKKHLIEEKQKKEIIKSICQKEEFFFRQKNR